MKPTTLLLIGAIAVSGGAVLSAPPAHAEMSAACAAHLARYPGVTAASDRRYHLGRGEESPCSAQDETTQQRAWYGDDNNPAARSSRSSRDDHRKDRRDRKSRFCARHWWC